MKSLFSILAIFLCSLSAQAQHGYISASGNVILSSGSIEVYSSPDIFVDAKYDTFGGEWKATIRLGATGSTTQFVKYAEIEFDNATVDAFTPSGSTTTEKTKNVMLQAVKAYLLALNGSTTFTLH